jgi:Mn-containing catalase
MYFTDGKLQYPVRVETPNPVFARMLQQAIGGVEGEIRVCLQYFFQAWGARGPAKYREMLLSTATEEIAHIEMLSTAVALNLEGAPPALQDEAVRQDPALAAILGGMNLKNYLSSGLAAMPVDSDGVPFDCSHIYASGNVAADMYANATAESTGRVLATRLHNFTDDPGMKDMLAFLIARDTMHQQQWLAVVEELGGYEAVLPIPNSFPQEEENQDVNYIYVDTRIGDDAVPLEGRFTSGPSLDGKGEFTLVPAEPMGEKPVLGPPDPSAFAQNEQMNPDDPATPTP